jgi:hypothetical protein
MRMMAENKTKHHGQYRNPSGNTYGSTMKQFRPFDYKALANKSQKGRNKSSYGASPFIIKHFGSPEAVPFIPKSQRGAEDTEIAGETDEQKEARLRNTAEQLLEKAKELARMRDTRSKAATKIQSLQKIRKSVKYVRGLKAAKAEEKRKKDEEAFRSRALTEEIDFYKANPQGFFSHCFGRYFKNKEEFEKAKKDADAMLKKVMGRR